MGVSVTYEMSANGRDVGYLQNAIDARRRELGETTAQAATATAIQVLKSIRANTKVANPRDMDLTVREAKGFVVGWKTKGKRRSRCVRIGNVRGPEVSSGSVRDIAGMYFKGENVKVYSVIDMVEGSKKRTERYLVLSKTEKDANEYARTRHVRRVKRYSGMAKFALTLAMMKTSGRGSDGGAQASRQAKQTASANVTVFNQATGGGSGDVSIYVHDNLDYATLALEGGEAYVETAAQKACNSIIGLINHKIGSHLTIHDRIKVPFPEEVS